MTNQSRQLKRLKKEKDVYLIKYVFQMVKFLKSK